MIAFARGKERSVLSSLFGASTSEDEDEEEEEPGPSGGGDDRGVEEEELTHRGQFAEIHLFQQKSRGIAYQLWPAATHLCNYIDGNTQAVFEPHGGVEQARVVELGAGIGLVGLYVAALGCKRTILTDLPKAMDILNRNIEANEVNGKGAVDCMPLSWGSSEEASLVVSALNEHSTTLSFPPLILAADCIYWECLFEVLVETLCELLAIPGARVLMSHVRRWKKDARFFKLCTKRGLSVTVLQETVEHVPAINTGLPERCITRIYSMHM
jgi:predicted nicotinamide N-methyase